MANGHHDSVPFDFGDQPRIVRIKGLFPRFWAVLVSVGPQLASPIALIRGEFSRSASALACNPANFPSNAVLRPIPHLTAPGCSNVMDGLHYGQSNRPAGGNARLCDNGVVSAEGAYWSRCVRIFLMIAGSSRQLLPALFYLIYSGCRLSPTSAIIFAVILYCGRCMKPHGVLERSFVNLDLINYFSID